MRKESLDKLFSVSFGDVISLSGVNAMVLANDGEIILALDEHGRIRGLRRLDDAVAEIDVTEFVKGLLKSAIPMYVLSGGVGDTDEGHTGGPN